MRSILDINHKNFFSKNLYLELEGLLTPLQIEVLKEHAEKIQGYDLWRSAEEVRKITHKQCYATWASELLKLFSLRYAFDLYLNGKQPFPDAATIQEISCLRPLAGALLLCLENIDAPAPFPSTKGHGLYVAADTPLPWGKILKVPNLKLLLIGFGHENTFFHADTKDPYALHLKKMGYSFNDLLSNDRHPLLNKKY